MNTQDFPLAVVENVAGETTVGFGHLAYQHASHTMILLSHVSNCFSSTIHDDVSVGLFEPKEDIHHFDLSLNDQRAVVEQMPRRMARRKNTIRVVWNGHRCNEIRRLVLGERCSYKSVFRRLFWHFLRLLIWLVLLIRLL